MEMVFSQESTLEKNQKAESTAVFWLCILYFSPLFGNVAMGLFAINILCYLEIIQVIQLELVVPISFIIYRRDMKDNTHSTA